MNMGVPSRVIVCCLLAGIAPTLSRAGQFVLVRDGRAQVAIISPGENQWAGQRLARGTQRKASRGD